MKLIFLTASFPYPPGEQFIEPEIPYLGESNFDDITILPSSALGEPRSCPLKIKVDTALADNKAILRYVLKTPFTKLFFRELIFLKKRKQLKLHTAVQALHSVAQVLRCYESLRKWTKKNGKADVAYTYWNDIASYAACLAKEKGLIKKVVSRAHGFDVYEERRKNNYMPLKRQFNNSYDKIFLLSTEAKNYFLSNYGFNKKNLDLAPLGVHIPKFRCSATNENRLNILSVSFLVHVKRIDRIIQGISDLASETPSLSITWTHIGDGPLKAELSEMALDAFKRFKNVTFYFKGHLENKDVVQFYSNNPVDFFINTSESEGIPVSIMEAMAAGVPAIATNVGGVSELVAAENGWLLNENPTTQEIKDAIVSMCHKSKAPEIRSQARKKIVDKFSSEKNYKTFMQKIQLI